MAFRIENFNNSYIGLPKTQINFGEKSIGIEQTGDNYKVPFGNLITPKIEKIETTPATPVASFKKTAEINQMFASPTVGLNNIQTGDTVYAGNQLDRGPAVLNVLGYA